jgi:ribosomal protein S18 acetylase RimI-like enzyme
VKPPSGSLRRARASDLERLTELWTEIAQHHAALDPFFTLRAGAGPTIDRVLSSQLADPDAAIFVWEDGTGVRGFCSVRIDRAPPILEETRRAEICDLGVDAGARRSGIGRKLVNAAIGWVRERGVTRIEIRVATGNREGQAFWRALGFGDLLDVLQRRL